MRSIPPTSSAGWTLPWTRRGRSISPRSPLRPGTRWRACRERPSICPRSTPAIWRTRPALPIWRAGRWWWSPAPRPPIPCGGIWRMPSGCRWGMCGSSSPIWAADSATSRTWYTSPWRPSSPGSWAAAAWRWCPPGRRPLSTPTRAMPWTSPRPRRWTRRGRSPTRPCASTPTAVLTRAMATPSPPMPSRWALPPIWPPESRWGSPPWPIPICQQRRPCGATASPS